MIKYFSTLGSAVRKLDSEKRSSIYVTNDGSAFDSVATFDDVIGRSHPGRKEITLCDAAEILSKGGYLTPAQAREVLEKA